MSYKKVSENNVRFNLSVPKEISEYFMSECKRLNFTKSAYLVYLVNKEMQQFEMLDSIKNGLPKLLNDFERLKDKKEQ